MRESRLAELKAMTFTTGINPATGHFDTDTERDLYTLAARCWNGMQDLIRERDHLVQAHTATTAELASWTGSLAP